MPQRQIFSVMKPHPIITIEAGDAVRAVAARMAAAHVGVAFAAGAAGGVEAMVTERDIVERLVADARNPDETAISGIWLATPRCVDETDRVADAVAALTESGQLVVPVLRNGGLVGFIGLQDFIGPDLEDLVKHVREAAADA